MLVLSFRDMSVPHRGAVTSAAMFDLDPVSAGLRWIPPPALKLAPWSDVEKAVRGKHVCFLVHGFNVDRDSGYTELGSLGQELAADGALVGVPKPTGPLNLHAAGIDVVIPVLWVGDWFSPINYPFVLPDIRLTGKYFADLIASSATQMSRVSFVSHSMGARVVLETMQAAIGKAGSRAPVFDTVVLTAAATSDEVLDDPDYADAVAAVRRFVIVSSRADHVLSGAFPAGNFVEKLLWSNDPGADDALGRYGPRLKAGSKALGKTEWYEIPQDVGQDHGDYLPNPAATVAPYPNGWAGKSVSIGKLASAVLGGGTPAWPPAKPISPV